MKKIVYYMSSEEILIQSLVGSGRKFDNLTFHFHPHFKKYVYIVCVFVFFLCMRAYMCVLALKLAMLLENLDFILHASLQDQNVNAHFHLSVAFPGWKSEW